MYTYLYLGIVLSTVENRHSNRFCSTFHRITLACFQENFYLIYSRPKIVFNLVVNAKLFPLFPLFFLFIFYPFLILSNDFFFFAFEFYWLIKLRIKYLCNFSEEMLSVFHKFQVHCFINSIYVFHFLSYKILAKQNHGQCI